MHKILKDGVEAASILWRDFIWLVTAILLVRPAFWAADDAFGHVPHSPLLGIAFYIGFMLLCVTAHELGHAVAGSLVGYRIHMIVVAAAGYRPPVRKFQYIFLTDSGDFGGYVFGTTPTLKNWAKRNAIFFAGGPLANLLLAAALFVAARSGAGDALKGVVANLALVSLVIGTQSLVPYSSRNGKSHSDGAQLLALMRGKRISAEENRASLLQGLHLDGQDATLWDDRAVAEIESGEVEPDWRAFRDHMLLHRYLAFGDLQKAKWLLEKSDAVKDGTLPSLTIEYAFLVALLDGDAGRADDLLGKAPDDACEKDFSFLRAKAVVHAIRGERDRAIAAVADARRIAKEEHRPLDENENALFLAIEQGRALPRQWQRRQAA
ncbi:MAG TPA: site-2 protease family protein [Rhizomicrobium sp.]|nr:site-2 protease family protein [Rhizomicrobium sp.]